MKFNYDTEILTHWIVIGPNVWGKGESRDEAMKNCMKQNRSRARLKDYTILRVGDQARIDGMGGVEFDPTKGYAQVEVVRDGKPVPEDEYMRLPSEATYCHDWCGPLSCGARCWIETQGEVL